MLIQNCTFTANSSPRGRDLACHSYEDQWPSSLDILNCIFWGEEEAETGGNASKKRTTSGNMGYGKRLRNEDGSKIAVRFSDLRGALETIADPHGKVIWGNDNIDADPLFADAQGGDYHLKSKAGRWDPRRGQWREDDVTSPCVDAGDPNSPVGLEGFPNGGRINVGAYGGTPEASKSYSGGTPCAKVIAGDIDGDCRVSLIDFALLASHWLEK
jgi:hypothetical protein